MRFIGSKDGGGILDLGILKSYRRDWLELGGLTLPSSFLGFPSGFGLGTYYTPDRIIGWSGLANTHFFFDLRNGEYAIIMGQCFPFSWRYQEMLTMRARAGSDR